MAGHDPRVPAMKCLVVIAHPLADSLCHALARTAIEALTAAGHEVVVEDLYRSGFDASFDDSAAPSPPHDTRLALV